jgi:hypothetical protein
MLSVKTILQKIWFKVLSPDRKMRLMASVLTHFAILTAILKHISSISEFRPTPWQDDQFSRSLLAIRPPVISAEDILTSGLIR